MNLREYSTHCVVRHTECNFYNMYATKTKCEKLTSEQKTEKDYTCYFIEFECLKWVPEMRLLILYRNPSGQFLLDTHVNFCSNTKHSRLFLQKIAKSACLICWDKNLRYNSDKRRKKISKTD